MKGNRSSSKETVYGSMDCIDPQVRGRRKGYFLFQQEEKNVGLSSVGAGAEGHQTQRMK